LKEREEAATQNRRDAAVGFLGERDWEQRTFEEDRDGNATPLEFGREVL
jgi:hypothetical protein